jgi:glucose 1-dehydrogenase
MTSPVAIVTGGTTGIGWAVAERLIRSGHRVLITGRDAGKGCAAAEALAEHGEVRFIQADVADPTGRREVLARALDSGGPLGVLINNAGTWDNQSIGEVTEDSWDQTFAVNVKGAFFMTQEVLPAMLVNGRGKVVNIASIAGLQGFAETSAYCATKGAVIAMTRALAVELGPSGINVNAVAPGNVSTPFNEHLMRQPGFQERLIARTPARRNGEPADIAGAVAFLASDDSDWVHGECLVVDGGWMSA